MPMDGTCPSCKFFDLIKASPRVLQSSSPQPDYKVWGNCRCHPPTMSGVVPYSQTDTNVQWPLCSSDDWCGQYIVGVAPMVVVSPNVSGDVTHPATLTTDNGTWNTQVNSYAYQWLSNGAAISNATANVYTTTGQDVGNTLSCMVTATNSVGSTSSISNGLSIS